MLTSLHITNFAIVKSLELDFRQGMTAFTGETGAGKSIMIDALMLAMGGRGDASVVRMGEEKCVISATFRIQQPSEPHSWLNDNDIDTEEGEVQLRRVILSEGRSKSYINGHLLPLQKVREFCEYLVHIHGQHQHQTLLQHSTHRQQLDQFAGHSNLLAEMKRCYQLWQQTQREIDALSAQQQDENRIQLLQFQLEELEKLQPQADELETLDREHQLLHHAKEYLQHADAVNTLLSNEEEINLQQGLHQALHHLQSLPQNHPRIQSALELLNNALIQCEEASDEIARFAEEVQLDPERLHCVEQRLSALHNTARKYHIDPAELPEHHHYLQTQLNALQQRDETLAALKEQLLIQEAECYKAAEALRSARRIQADKLSKAISSIIQELGMPKGYVEVELTPLEAFHSHGMDRVEYKVCTNPGMRPDTLGKIASGGELSRISLAIQMITAQQGATPTLLFDEVDVGIGGATAALVGKLLRQLGGRLQVFCVTHQPQVAACAHQQLRVEKHSEQDQTFSRIIPLTEAQRTEEIARMLGGLTISEQTRSSAREMLAQSTEAECL